MKRICFHLLWVFVLAVQTATASKPNVLMILVDDLGYGDLSSYGARDLQSPQIDGLVKSGMRFENFYANCPVCSPTRASLLTGRYPDLVGVPGVIRTMEEDSWGYLSPDARLLPLMLKRAGYHTALIGKWHLGLEKPNTPLERGFDIFQGFLGDMMDDYYHHRRHGINYMRDNQQVIHPEDHATDLFTKWAIEHLYERRKEEAPFFLYLAYNAPHTPIQPPEEWLERVRQREPGISEKRAKLVAFIEHMDAGIGRVIQALEDTGQQKNTLVLFTSDNGGQLAVGANCGDFRGGKQDVYEGGLRVPFCAVWPGRIQAGSSSPRVALTMDLFPTICEVAGKAIDHRIDGTSILPTLLGGDQPELDKRPLFFMRREGNLRYHGQDYYAVRLGDWKLVQNNPFQPLELFNLAKDPQETTNRIQSNPKQYQELSRLLRRQIQRAGAVPWQPPLE